ncbi:hypothetical protein FRB90_006531 [Tulasnella sp. 427]|nr:hypothetical protein FRB90_006531 [Tulasnella sp. 427]
MLLSFLSLAAFSLIGALAFIPSSTLSSTLAKPVIVKTTAWLGLIGWVFGMITTTVLYIYFGSNCTTFNNDAAAGGEMLLAELASGFSMLGLAFGLALFPLICSLVGQLRIPSEIWAKISCRFEIVSWFEIFFRSEVSFNILSEIAIELFI